MEQKKATYEANVIPKTLGEVLRALCEPFSDEECGWRILSRRGPEDNWIWVRYPIGEFMKRRVALCCSGGYSVSYAHITIGDRPVVEATITIHDPQRPTEHRMTLEGIREINSDDDLLAARTYAFKDACEQAGMGVGEGARLYTLPYVNPDGEKTDKNGIPLSEYENGSMRGPRRPSSQSNTDTALTDAGSVRTWLTASAEQVDLTHLSEDAYAKHAKALAKTLEKMGFDSKQVMDAAWGDGERTVQQVIAVQGLIARKASKQILQHLVN